MSRYSKSDRDIFMEVLKPSMGAGAYIKDFRKSDAPQFKGKTEKEKDKMAVAAYLDAKDQKEEVEVVTEREDTASEVAKALKKMGVKYDRNKEDSIISKIPKVLDSMKLSPGAKRMLLRDRDFIADVLDDLGETKLPPHLAKLFDKDGNFKDKKKQAMFDKMQKAARKGIKFTSKDVTPKGFGPEEGIEEQTWNAISRRRPSMQALIALVADTKNAQEGIAKIMKALKVDEKKATAIMDKIIAAALKEEVEIQEDGHTDVPSSIRMCKTIAEDAGEIEQALASKGDENLDTWWTNKLAVASNSMNKLRDYITTPVQEEQMDEAIKYTYVAVDDKGKIIGFSGGSKAAADAKDMARRNNGVVHKLKKPMSQKVGDMEINRPFNPVLKAEVEEVEESAMLNLATVKFQAKEKLGKIRHKVTKKGNKYIISVDSNDEEDAQKAMKDHPLYAAGKLRVMPESFYKKITGVDSLRENRAKRDAMRAMGRRRGKDPADIDTDASDDDVKAASKNIVMQLRKAVSMRGNFDVEFEKEKKKVPANIAQAALDRHARLRTSMDKGEFDKKIRKSYRDLLNALKEK